MKRSKNNLSLLQSIDLIVTLLLSNLTDLLFGRKRVFFFFFFLRNGGINTIVYLFSVIEICRQNCVNARPKSVTIVIFETVSENSIFHWKPLPADDCTANNISSSNLIKSFLARQLFLFLT